MPRSSRQKEKLLYLRKILLEKTDEEHALTITEIKDLLASYDIQTERKALYDDLRILENYGLDICKTRTKTVRYFVGSRDFELAELKLLVDAIQSSKFITHKKSRILIKKLEGLVSENEGKELQREVYMTNRVKTLNEQIYIIVDQIHTAISENRKISFKYTQWELDFTSRERIVKRERHGGKLYTVSPWALCWDDENYYMVAYDSEAEIIKHYRVDKMTSVSIVDEERDGSANFDKFDLAHYSKRVFSMFGGEECDVKLRVDNSLIGVIADRFGSDVFIVRDDDEHFIVNVRVMLSPQFYAWLFGLGLKVEILAPKRVLDDYKLKLLELSNKYEE